MSTIADTGAGFLAAIIAEPAEDVHRLVSAKFAEKIRLPRLIGGLDGNRIAAGARCR